MVIRLRQNIKTIRNIFSYQLNLSSNQYLLHPYQKMICEIEISIYMTPAKMHMHMITANVKTLFIDSQKKSPALLDKRFSIFINLDTVSGVPLLLLPLFLWQLWQRLSPQHAVLFHQIHQPPHFPVSIHHQKED